MLAQFAASMPRMSMPREALIYSIPNYCSKTDATRKPGFGTPRLSPTAAKARFCIRRKQQMSDCSTSGSPVTIGRFWPLPCYSGEQNIEPEGNGATEGAFPIILAQYL